MGKVAIYARVSTLDKQDYQRQISDCKTAIGDLYTEDDIEIFAEQLSGYKSKEHRPELTKLLNLIDKDSKSFDSIYVTEISRLGRDPRETRNLIDNLTEKKIPIYITSIKRKTLDENGERDTIMNIIIQVLMEFADNETKTLKKRSQSGLLQSAKVKGNAGGGIYLPYGYTKDETKKLIVDDAESEIIKDIFNYYQEGKGCKKIAGLLNSENIPTRANKIFSNRPMKVGDKNSDDIIWSDKTINDIIRNSIYKGDRKYKGEVIKAPAIISIQQYDECIRIMDTKTHRNYLTTYTYLLKDLLVCGCCGRNYFAKFKPVAGGDKVYICSSRLIRSGNCGNIGINISLLESTIYNEIVISEDILQFLGNKDIKKKLQSNVESLQQELITIQKQQATIENRKKRLLDLYENSTTIEVEEYDLRQTKLINEQESIWSKIKLLNKELAINKSALTKQNDKKATQQMLIDAKDNRSELATIFKQFIDKVVITPIDKNYSSIALHACVNGVKLPEPLYIKLDMAGIRKKPIQYNYKSYFIPPYDGEEVIEDYYFRLEQAEKIRNNTPNTTITDNLILIENTYPIK